MELKCAVQTYDWGKRGNESIVARLLKASSRDFVIEEGKPYAELWMGTHQNGQSSLKKDGTFLRDYIRGDGQILGAAGDGRTLEDLPFLFKVLSVGKALSIQVHPDKKKAEKLHLEQPNIYKDSNHKPELAIALSCFEAFCGFRPINEIRRYVEMIPELRAVIGSRLENALLILDRDCDENRQFLTICFKGILSQESATVTDQLDLLIERLSKLDESERQFLHADLLERLSQDFPGDVGCFGVYFFNLIKLEPDEAIYIASNEPHAYLSGDCIECMACSDNVVRAGLTPKLKDIPTLIEMLTYNCEGASAKLFKPVREDKFTEIFRPPVPDFAVAKITIFSNVETYDLIPRSTASILLTIEGKAETLTSELLGPGIVLFVSANEKITLRIYSYPVRIFQAFAN